MANILLTNQCVRSCPYCFAKKHMEGTVPDDVMSWENIIYIADLFESSGERHLSLLGGEPTLHPDFIDIVMYLIERRFHVNVFTSGVMSDRMLLDAQPVFGRLNPKQLSFVVNLNDPKYTNFAELQSIHRFFKAFPHLTSVGFNIYREDFNMDFIFEYIMRFGLKAALRLGLAHRIPGVKNAHIKPMNLRKMAENLISYMPTFERLGINPGFDCGFPLCKFTDEELGMMWKIMGSRLKFGCGPALDIGPDMTVWTCFPLNTYQKKSIYDFDTVQDMKKFYQNFMDKVRGEINGIYEECATCTYREKKLCTGGCIAHALHSMKEEDQIRFEEVYV